MVRKIPKKNGLPDFDNELKFFNRIKNKNDPHIVKLLYVNQKERIILLEHCVYKSLNKVIDKDQLLDLPISKKSILLDILQGINFLHQFNLVHFDISPRNILLCMTNSLLMIKWFQKFVILEKYLL